MEVTERERERETGSVGRRMESSLAGGSLLSVGVGETLRRSVCVCLSLSLLPAVVLYAHSSTRSYTRIARNAGKVSLMKKGKWSIVYLMYLVIVSFAKMVQFWGGISDVGSCKHVHRRQAFHNTWIPWTFGAVKKNNSLTPLIVGRAVYLVLYRRFGICIRMQAAAGVH